jgi:hypothetical protein
VNRTVSGSRTWLYAHQLVARLTLWTGEVFETTFGHDTALWTYSRHCPSIPLCQCGMAIMFDSLYHVQRCRAKSVRFGHFAARPIVKSYHPPAMAAPVGQSPSVAVGRVLPGSKGPNGGFRMHPTPPGTPPSPHRGYRPPPPFGSVHCRTENLRCPASGRIAGLSDPGSANC